MNIQDNIALPYSQIAWKISLTALVGTLGYQYNINKNMSLFLMAGRSFEQEGKLRNDKQGDVYLLNNEANFYIRTGFKIGIF